MWPGTYAHEAYDLQRRWSPTRYVSIAEPSPCPSLRGDRLFLAGDGKEKFYECELEPQSPLIGNT
jgi:hypothetical protein